MPVWVSVTLAAIAVLAAWLGIQCVSSVLTRRHLQRLFTGRNAEFSLESSVACFPDLPRERVVLAYRWVQMLINFDSPPIYPADDLSVDLKIDQGETDNRFECSHEWRGESSTQTKANDRPVKTVRDPMEEVLSYGYEGYPH